MIFVIGASALFSTVYAHRIKPHRMEGHYGPRYRKIYGLRRIAGYHLEIAGYLRENTPESETVYAWGFSPDIYFFSGRRCGSRFIVSDAVAGRVPGSYHAPPVKVPGAEELLISDLQRNRPRYFVDTSLRSIEAYYSEFQLPGSAGLWEYVRTNYEPKTVIGRDVVHRRRLSPPEEAPEPYANEYVRAIRYYDRILEMEPEFSEAYFFRGLARYRLGGAADTAALDDFNRALEGMTTPRLLFFRGLARLQLGAAAAEEDFRAVLRMDSSRAEAWLGLGIARAAAGDYRRAEEAMEEALRLRPGMAAARKHLAFVYRRTGRDERAREQLEKLEALEGD